jgi:hypothetical protein
MFMYFIPLTVNLTKNSKLEKFVHELNALWKLSGSSMGALRELIAVAGIEVKIEKGIIVALLAKSHTSLVTVSIALSVVRS